jgi:hypothetical protein
VLAKVNAVRNPNQIPTGTQLRIPLRLMQTQAVPATAGAPGRPGTKRRLGAEHRPGRARGQRTAHRCRRPRHGAPGGRHAAAAAPGQHAAGAALAPLRGAGGTLTGTRLDQGRVEIEAAPAAAGRPGFRIDTPQGVLGVRGTEFRVSTEGSQGATRGEVLSGTVAFAGRSGGPAEPVDAGFGTVIGAAGQVAAPVRLLDAPSVADLPTLQERLLMRFALPPLAGAAAYRAQISADARFDRVLADLTSATPELRFAELPDGDYVLRVRAVDARGLEGQDADHRFRLKARPEAPLPSAPVPRAVIFGSKAELAWTANTQAQSYRLRLVQAAPAASAWRQAAPAAAPPAASRVPTSPARCVTSKAWSAVPPRWKACNPASTTGNWPACAATPTRAPGAKRAALKCARCRPNPGRRWWATAASALAGKAGPASALNSNSRATPNSSRWC